MTVDIGAVAAILFALAAGAMDLAWWVIGVATCMFAVTALPTQGGWTSALFVRLATALVLCAMAYAFGSAGHDLYRRRLRGVGADPTAGRGSVRSPTARVEPARPVAPLASDDVDAAIPEAGVALPPVAFARGSKRSFGAVTGAFLTHD
jgi:hypothetical protein